MRNKESTEAFSLFSLFLARQMDKQKDLTHFPPSQVIVKSLEDFCWLSFVLAFYSMNEPANMLVAPSQLSHSATPSLVATLRRPTRTAATTAAVAVAAAAAPPPTKS
jgi:hypothetical protein